MKITKSKFFIEPSLKAIKLFLIALFFLIINQSSVAQINSNNVNTVSCGTTFTYDCFSPYNPCNAINNPDFENLQQTVSCLGQLTDNIARCWTANLNSGFNTINTVDILQILPPGAPNNISQSYAIPITYWGGISIRKSGIACAGMFPGENCIGTFTSLINKKYFLEFYTSFPKPVSSGSFTFSIPSIGFSTVIPIINEPSSLSQWTRRVACIDLTSYPLQNVSFATDFLLSWSGLQTFPYEYVFIDDFVLTEFPEIIANTTSICSGTSVTLSMPCGDLNNSMTPIANTAAGFGVPNYIFQYDWLENGALLSYHGATLTKSPTTTTTYTLVASIIDAANNNFVVCSNTSSVTVTVKTLPLMPVITSNTVNPCVGTPVIYSVPNQNNVTFTWHFPGGVILTGNTVSYAWQNSNGSVYVTATNSAGCSIQSAVYTPTIYSSYCCAAPSIFVSGPQLIQTSQQVFGGSPPPNSIIQVDPGIKLVINTACTFDNCVIFMRTKSSIEVQNKLTITNKSFLNNCEDFWNGITINNGATLIMNQNSRIQDAENAITVLAGGKYDINTVIFNRNYKGIVWMQNTSSNNSTIYNSIFTCRDIPNNTFVSALKTNNLLASCPFQSLRYPFTSPNNYTRGVVGIEVNFVDNLVPVTTPHFELMIGESVQGSSMSNVFDNLDYGVWANRSNVLIQNNVFQNLSGYNAGNIQSNSGTGILVYGNNSVQSQENCIQIGGFTSSPSNYQKNIFNNCGSAVEVYSYNSVKAIGNVISNANNTLANSQTSAWVGRYGIKVASKYESNLLIASNNITNCLDGINWSHTNYGKRFYASILQNVITSTSNGACNNGIAGTFGIKGSLPESSPVVIESNIITTAINGINLKGAKTFGIERFSVGMNTIILKSNTSVTKGISSVNADNVWIHDNTITSNSRNYPTAHGIFIQNSPNSTFECNSISTLGSCMVFSGNCVNPFGKGCIYNNTFSNAKNGIEVYTGGNLGTQGAGFVPSDNKWAAAANSFNGFHIINSGVPINLWRRTTNPTGIAGYTMLPNNIQGIVPINTTGVSGKICYSNSQLENTNTLTEAEDALIEEVLENNDSSNLLLENIYMNKKYAMDMLLHDSLLNATSDSLLLEFLDSVKLETVYDLEQVNELVLDSDYVAAQNLNSSLASTFLMEQNQIILNDWNLRLLDNPSCMSDTAIFNNFLLALAPIANQCAYLGGEAVVSARALLYCFTNDYFEYDDDCESSTIGNRMAQNKSQTQKLNPTNNKIKIAPNPTSGQINLNYCLNSDAEMQIYNSYGSMCRKIILKASNTLQVENLEQLNTGTYIYKIKLPNGRQIVGKIDVVK